MSAAEFLKGQCQHCGDSIEFPAEGTGQTAPCPHCGQLTVLQAAAPAPAAGSRTAKKSSAVTVSIVVIGLLAIAGFVVLQSMRKPRGTGRESATVASPDGNPALATDTNRQTESSPTTNAPAPKSLVDFKTGPVTLEKTKGSSLVYAVGVLRNESDHQRFGVNIELELTDARGNKIGTAKDYRAVIEPRHEWRFRALVLDSKATIATVSAIREE